MSDEEHHFESKADAGASKTYPQQAGTIRKNGYIVIKGRPCKVLDFLFIHPCLFFYDVVSFHSIIMCFLMTVVLVTIKCGFIRFGFRDLLLRMWLVFYAVDFDDWDFRDLGFMNSCDSSGGIILVHWRNKIRFFKRIIICWNL